MTTRYVLIRYQDSAGTRRIGSGYIVRGSTVLTANHVADGTGHQIECDDSAESYSADPAKTVLSGTDEVDLGVLQLAGDPLQLEQLSFGRVGRDAMIINDCMAVGFPRWTADERDRQYESKQVEGFIRTAERVRMRRSGGADGQLLRLTIKWKAGDRRVPVPAGQLDGVPENPWGGMSGAVVTAPGMVLIGVVHSHNHARDRNVLTVTPLLALTQLREAKRRQFCDALGIADLNDLPMVTSQELSGLPGRAAVTQPVRRRITTSPASVFSDGIRDRFQQELARLGLQAPPAWDRDALEQLYRDCRQRVMLQGADAELRRARDLAKALWLAAAALPLLSRFGGQEIDIRKLQYLYHQHVQSPPECATLDGMLIRAAGVGYGRSTKPRAAAASLRIKPSQAWRGSCWESPATGRPARNPTRSLISARSRAGCGSTWSSMGPTSKNTSTAYDSESGPSSSSRPPTWAPRSGVRPPGRCRRRSSSRPVKAGVWYSLNAAGEFIEESAS